MNNFENLLIWVENNETRRTVGLLDDHFYHIKKHLPFLYKKGMIKHIFEHITLNRKKKKLGLEFINTSDIMNHLKNSNRWYE